MSFQYGRRLIPTWPGMYTIITCARLKKTTTPGEHAITVPAHKPIAKGTLNDIINAVSRWNGIPKGELLDRLRRQ